MMKTFAGFACYTLFLMTTLLPVVNTLFSVTEPGRATHIYGQEFLVVVPLTTGLPENGSTLQIACVSCPSSSVTGRITLLQENFDENFTVQATAPTLVSLHIAELESLANTSTPAVFNITVDANVTVTVFVKVAGSLNAYTAIPIASLDQYYIVASFGSEPEDQVSELTVVATEPETYFHFQPNSTVTIPGHENLIATAEFERGFGGWVTYEAETGFMGGHLQSKKKPILGLVETHSTSPNVQIQSWDQLYPLVALGTRYTAVPVTGNNRKLHNVFRIVPVWDNTNIHAWTTKGQSITVNRILNSGQVYDLSLSPDDIGQVQGSKPFLLLHNIKKGIIAQGTATVTIPPAEQFTRQTFTFSTYELETEVHVQTYITIMVPNGKYLEHIIIRKSHGEASKSKVVKRRSVVDGDYCGYNHQLDAGVYTIGLDPASPPEAVYSAVLYGQAGSSIFAYLLASELNQVTCSTNHSAVTLCPPFVPIQPALTTVQASTSVATPTSEVTPTVFTSEATSTVPTMETSTTPHKDKSVGSGTVIGAVVAVISIVAGLVIIGCCIFYRRRRKWEQLDESEYLEDNPLRMRHITEAVSGI